MHYIVFAAQDTATTHVHVALFHLTTRILCIAQHSVPEHVYVCHIFFRKLTTILSPKTAAFSAPVVEYNAGACR